MSTRVSVRLWLAFLATSLLISSSDAAGALPADEFDKVGTVLINRCYECHNPIDRSGGLDLSTREGLLKGGKNGPVVVPGQADDSVLLQRVVDGEMPPKKQGKPQPLSPAEVERLSRWLARGAEWPTGRTLDPFETTSDTRAGR